jgi:hypothetical protein
MNIFVIFVCFLVLGGCFATVNQQNIFLKSESTSIEVINGKPHKIYLATLSVSQDGVCSINDDTCANPKNPACCAPVFTIQDSNGGQHDVQFFVEKPRISTSRKLIGWLPRAVFPQRNTVLLSDYAINSTAINDPSYMSSPTDNAENSNQLRLTSRFLSKVSSQPHLAAGIAKAFGEPRPSPYDLWSNRKHVQDDDLDFIMKSNQFKPVQGPNRKLLQIGTAIIAAGVVSIGEGLLCRTNVGFLGDFLGCKPDYADAINTLNKEVMDIQKFDNETGKWIDDQKQWDTRQEDMDNFLVARNNIVLSQLKRLQRDVSTNYLMIISLQDVVKHLSEVVDNGFRNIRDAFTATNEEFELLASATSNTTDDLQSQITRLVNLLDNVDNTVKGTIITQYQMYRKLQQRRALILQFWNMLFDTEALDSCPFVQCLGRQPMPLTGTRVLPSFPAACTAQGVSMTCEGDADDSNHLFPILGSASDNRYAQSSIQNAARLARTRLLYTFDDGGTRKAGERIFEYVCDREYLLAHSMPGIDFKTMFRFMGPAPFNSTTACYPGTVESDHWSCYCVIVQYFYTCPLKENAPMFPWGWAQTGSLQYAPEAATHCDGGPTGVGISPHLDLTLNNMISTTGSVFSTLESWTSFLSYFCQQTGQTLMPDTVTGHRVRVTSDSFGSFVDLDLNDRNGTSVCQADPLQLLILKDNRFRLSYVIYQYWTYAYEVAGSILFPIWEKMIYGGPPTDVNYEVNPWSLRPDLHTTLDSTTMSFVKISAEGISEGAFKPTQSAYGDNLPVSPGQDATKIPVYSVQISDISYSATMVVDYNIPQGLKINTSTISTGNCDQINGLNTVCSAISLELDDEFKEVSSILTNIIIAGDFDLPDAPIYDIPPSLMKTGTAGSLCRSMMYMFQPRTVSDTGNNYGNDWKVPINARDWVATNKVAFDPTCVTESPHYYLKHKDPDTGECDGDLDIHLNYAGTDRTENDYCRLLHFYKLDAIADRTVPAAYWIPKKYTLGVTFQVPQGQFVQNIRSSCPTFYNITKNKQSLTGVWFFTNSTSEVTVNIVYTIYGSKALCPGNTLPPAIDRITYSSIKPYYYEAQECGSQFVNVSPLDTDQLCYPAPGLDMYRAHSGSDGPIVPSQVNQQITIVKDQVVKSMADNFVLLTEIQASLAELRAAAIPRGSLVDTVHAAIEGIVAREKAALDELTKDSENANYADGVIDRLHEAAMEEAQDIINGQIANQEISDLDDKIANTTIAINDATQKIINDTAAVDAALAKELADAKDASVKKGDKCGGGVFGFLLAPICVIEDLIDGKIDGFMAAVQIILYIAIVLCVLLCVVKPCIDSGAAGVCWKKMTKSSKSSSATTDTETTKPVTQSTKSRYRVQKSYELDPLTTTSSLEEDS